MWIDDQILKRCDQPRVIDLWIPKETVVVLGRSNAAEQECKTDHCHTDQIAILKRYGGGGTVVLHQGCVIVGLGLWVRDYYANDRYFRLINQALIDALKAAWPKLAGLSQDGHSDIVYGSKKIAGTSLFRSRNYLLYQASILVEAKLPLIERYLGHPTKEPDYRGKRRHDEFLTDLHTLANAQPGEVLEALQINYSGQLDKHLAEQIIEVKPDQIPHLLKKIEG